MKNCKVEFERLNEITGLNEKYYQIDDKKQDIVDKQINLASTTIQKKLADILVKNHSKISGVNSDSYIDSRDKNYTRVTKFIKNLRDGYYSFDSNNDDESNYEINSDWGNIVDTVFEGLVLNKNIDEIYSDVIELANGMSISKEAIIKVKDSITNLKKLHPSSIFIPQLTLSSNVGLAGTLDLLVIEPDGAMHIYDLKTSTEPITKNSTKTTALGTPIHYRYDKVYTKKDGLKRASKKQRHQTQLNFYKAFIKEITGLEAESMSILPAQISIDENSNIENLEFEPTFIHENDNSILESMEKSTSKEEFITDLTDLSNTEFLNQVIEILENEVRILKKQGKYQSVPKIQSIIESIQIGNGISDLSEFIEYMHEEFVSGNNSLEDRFSEFLDETKDDYSNYVEVLNRIDLFKSEVELFRGVIEQLQTLEDSVKDITSENNSNIDKLNNIMTTFNRVERISKTKIIPIISKILSEQLPGQEIKDKLASKIETIKKKLTKRNITDKRKKELIQELQEVQIKYNESDETIREALETGNYKDISLLSSNLNPAISVNNTIIATFAKTLKEQFEKARIKLFGLEKIAAKAFDEYASKSNSNRNDVAEFNKPFYEILDSNNDKPYYALIQKLDYNAYKKVMDNLYAEKKIKAKELKSKGKYPGVSINNLTSMLVTEESKKLGYLKARNAEDTYLENPYTGEKVVLEKGYNSIIEEYKNKLSDKSYEKWLDSQFKRNENGELIPYGRAMFLPNSDKFLNSKYEELIKDESKLKYYNFLLSTYLSAQKLIKHNNMFFQLPGIEKISNDRLREQGVTNWTKRFVEGIIDYLPNEEEEYGQEIKKRIPHYYSENIGIENTSLDLIGSILRYTAAAERYAAQSNMEQLSNSLLDIVSSKGPLHSSETNLSKLKIGNSKLGEYFRKYKGNNTAAMLEALIDVHIYGKNRIKSEGPWNKIVDGLMGFASFTQIGGNPVLAVANSMAAHISSSIDAYANEYFSPKTWMWSKLEYRKNEVEFWKDMVGTTKRSKLGQLTELYDALQGEYFDHYGRKMSQGAVKKMWGSKAWFAGMHKGEHAAQTKVMMSVLKDTKITTSNGSEISLYDAYDLDENGNLVIKSGINTDLLNMQAMNKIHALNKRFNGVYNSFDKPLIERHNLGRLIMMYRKFIAPNVRRRFKGWGFDYELNDEYEGYYRTFFRTLLKEKDELLNLITKKEHNLTKHEVANIKRTTTEITYMLLMSSLIALLSAGLDDLDDDDEPTGIELAMKYSIYWLMRASSELSFYNFGLGSINTALLPLNPGGTLRSFRTPSPIYSTLEKSFNALRHTGALIGNPSEAYYKNSSDYNTIFGNLGEKGDPKAVVSWMKLMGLNGYLMNIDNAIKILEIYD